jgi:DHA1 family tetracycline resistance protein-like MFS transporter
MRRSPLIVVYLAVFVDLLGFGIILPILPFYAEKFGADGFWVGAVLTAYSAAQFVGAILLGRLSDRIGRRPVLLASLVGSAISLTVMGLANSLWILLLSRLLAGAFGGSITTAQAYIADVTDSGERTKYMGLLGASIGMGFVFGPAIGAGLSGFGFSTAAFVAATLALANFIFGCVALRESRTTEHSVSRRARLNSSNLMRALRHPDIGRILISSFLATFAFVGMEATFALFGQARFGLDAGSLGLIFTFVGVVIAVVQGGLIGRLDAKFSERALALAGAVVMGLALVAIPLVSSLVLSMVVLAALAMGQGLLTPTLSSLLSQASEVEEQGGTLGLGQSVGAGARAIGPLITGWMFDRGMWLPYIAGAVLVLCAAWILRGVRVRAPLVAVEAEGE